MPTAKREMLHFPASDSQHIGPFLPPPTSAISSTPTAKPFVTLTFATSLDSQLSIAPGVQTLLSGPESKAMTHYLRSKHDAILIGAGTAVADDPSLNCRIEGVGGYGGEGLEGQPRPIVVDPKGRWEFSVHSKVIKLASEGRGKAPFVITDVAPVESKKALLEGFGGKYLVIKRSSGTNGDAKMDWSEILKALKSESLRTIMIEGGGFIINDLLSSQIGFSLIDSVIVTIAPIWLGKGGVQVCPGTAGQGLSTTRLTDVKWVPLGEDIVLCGRPNLTLR